MSNSPAGQTFDVVIVGARPSGAALAITLAEAGVRVALIDKATFPSDTMSTHVVYPNTLARLEDLGVLDDIMAHKPPPLYTAWHHEDRMFVAPHSPLRGRDWALCVRRITLDAIMVRRAVALGATLFEGTMVNELIGSGTEEDPVHGVRARNAAGTLELHAPIVVGADGANSTIARIVGAARTKQMPTETMLYYAYWTGAKARNTQDFFFEPPWVCAHFPADDDHHVITMNGPSALRSSIADLEAFYQQRIAAIPSLATRLKTATKVSRVIGTTKLEGFYRQHVGPGWALVGDAAHFKHPAGAQGIGDAIHAAQVLAAGIRAGDWQRSYPAWREADSREFYAFCKHLAEPPGDAGMRTVMDACIADAHLARRVVDVWARSSRPWTDVIPFVPGMERITGVSIDQVLAPYEATQAEEAVAA